MFMYENTDARSHRVAAAADRGRRRRQRDLPPPLRARCPTEKLRLLARALDRVERHLDGALSTTYISAEDYAATGADEVLTEGIIDHVRALEGTARRRRDPRQAEQRRRRPQGEPALHRRQRRRLRRSPARWAAGGHRRAAGFSTDLSYDELVEFLQAETAAQLG